MPAHRNPCMDNGTGREWFPERMSGLTSRDLKITPVDSRNKGYIINLHIDCDTEPFCITPQIGILSRMILLKT
jgi:hypothetical protein